MTKVHETSPQLPCIYIVFSDSPNRVSEAFREEVVDAVVLAAPDLYLDRPHRAAALRHLIMAKRQSKKHITGPNVRDVRLEALTKNIPKFHTEIISNFKRIDTQEQQSSASR